MLADEALQGLRARFLRFVQETHGQSPLYERLSRAAADDVVALEILAAAPDARQRRAGPGRRHRLLSWAVQGRGARVAVLPEGNR